jgi:23S rRNA pseudouridine1911/1915/1917 synthase
VTGDSSGTRHDFTSEADNDVRLDLLIAERVGVSRTQAATLIATNAVTVTTPGSSPRVERASYRPRQGEMISVVVPPPPDRDVLPEDIPLSVMFEDEHLLVVDKPAGMVVHPAPGNWSGTLVNALLGRGTLAAGGGEERPGIVHRIDKETSGLLVVAKTDRAHRTLSSAIAARRVVRRYAAMAWGHLDRDELTVDKPLARDPRDRRKVAVVATGRAAKTTLVRLARCARTCTPAGRTRSVSTSRPSAIRSSATTPMAVVAAGKSWHCPRSVIFSTRPGSGSAIP